MDTRTSPAGHPHKSDRDHRPFHDHPVGIWIDSLEAVIVQLDPDGHQLTRVTVDEERHKNTIKAKHHANSGSGTVTSHKRAMGRLEREHAEFFERVMKAPTPAGRVVVFGPAYMKGALEKVMRDDARWKDVPLTTATAARMTDGQRVAWVKAHFEHSTHHN